MKITLVTALMTLGMASSALADTACVRPTAPAMVDGATASLDEIKAASAATRAFIAASDSFQTCVIDSVTAQRAAAKAAKTKFDKAIATAADAEIVANQADKEKAGADFSAALRAYRAAHPS